MGRAVVIIYEGSSTMAQIDAAIAKANGDSSPPVAQAVPIEFPYQQTFNAIVAAVNRTPDGFEISVRRFQDEFNAAAPQPAATEPKALTDAQKSPVELAISGLEKDGLQEMADAISSLLARTGEPT
jgi:hypothetical protein